MTRCTRLAIYLTGSALSMPPAAAIDNFASGGEQALHRGVYEVALEADQAPEDPWLSAECDVTFTRPDGSAVPVRAFFDGGAIFRARAYCDQVGAWRWQSSSKVPGLGEKSGAFEVVESELPGKLRIHATDPWQFAYDNGEWFLHIGDTGYRYLAASEPKWREYIDQAAEMGATKVRTWFCEGRSDVAALLTGGRSGLALDYWQEMERRLRYALERHPHVIFQLIPYGEDIGEVRRYGGGDAPARLIASHAQSRFSAFPNVTWCASNDLIIVTDGRAGHRDVHVSVIDAICADMHAREPWATLITNHQARFTGYRFVHAEWSDIITLEDQDQVAGELMLEYRAKSAGPVVMDEDRYEHHREPAHKRYFFRRLMWASLLSGAHATYGGLRTYEPYDGDLRGVQGYFDACAAGKLAKGAHDFRAIHRFFEDTRLTLVGMTPDDAFVGGEPMRRKCIRDDRAVIVYLANPSGTEPGTDAEGSDWPTVDLALPPGIWRARWFDPGTGEWSDGPVVESDVDLAAPGPGDWVLLLVSVGPQN